MGINCTCAVSVFVMADDGLVRCNQCQLPVVSAAAPATVVAE